jgi:hypothetical protein
VVRFSPWRGSRTTDVVWFARRDLYVLTLSELQALHETDELSFGITGIDAYPRDHSFPNWSNSTLII